MTRTSEDGATTTLDVIPQTALSLDPTASAIPDSNDGGSGVGGGGHRFKNNINNHGLSPLAEQLLIAAGAIGTTYNYY